MKVIVEDHHKEPIVAIEEPFEEDLISDPTCVVIIRVSTDRGLSGYNLDRSQVIMLVTELNDILSK
jgi:hypothetical protein